MAAIGLTSFMPLTYAKPSSAEEGVSLLEEILQKMRNLPQIALNKPNQPLAYKPQLLANNTIQAANNSDYLKRMQEQSLPSSSPLPVLGPQVQSQAQFFDEGSQTGSLGLPQEVRGKSLAKKSERPQIASPGRFYERQNCQLLDAYRKAEPNIVANGSPAAKMRAAGGFSSYSTTPSPPAAAMPAGKMPMLKGVSNSTIGPQKQYELSDRPPLICDSHNALAQMPSSIGAGQSNMAGAVTHAYHGPALKSSIEEKYLPNTRFEIAMSPPAVIMGVPLIRLGNSEKQVTSVMGSLGKIHKDYFHGWSVWSLQKDNCSDFSIQVFMRHGLVEAIRVFDPSFFRQDFGVVPGDELTKVKTKFGEPAFILSDKVSQISQNYVYPISQVGFQISRTQKEQVPKIASILIFSVK